MIETSYYEQVVRTAVDQHDEPSKAARCHHTLAQAEPHFVSL